MSIEYSLGLTVLKLSSTQLHSHFGRCLEQRLMRGSCRCHNEGWSWRWESMQARSHLPQIITFPSPNVSEPPLHCPFPRCEPAIYNCLASPFPSVISSFRTGLADGPGLLNLRWTIQAGKSLSTISIREWGKERDQKESLTADRAILWLKVSSIVFPIH